MRHRTKRSLYPPSEWTEFHGSKAVTSNPTWWSCRGRIVMSDLSKSLLAWFLSPNTDWPSANLGCILTLNYKVNVTKKNFGFQNLREILGTIPRYYVCMQSFSVLFCFFVMWGDILKFGSLYLKRVDLQVRVCVEFKTLECILALFGKGMINTLKELCHHQSFNHI